jgi:FAD:protein FMN transferase
MSRRGRSNRAFRWFYEVESRCTAMLADALATAAFVLGPEDGLALLESHGVDGLIVAADLQPHKTRGLLHVA